MGAPGPANLTHVADYAIPLREYALVFGTAVVVTFLLTGVVRLIAVQMGVVTPIRDRDVHSLPIPRMGGVAVYAGFAAAVLMALQLPALGVAFISSSEVVGVLAAGGLICLVGVLDDRFDLDAIAKLAGQILAAGIKQATRRSRPEGSGYSFPSGHTTVTFASATVLQRHFGWKVGIPAYGVAAYVAASRVEMNRHYLSDVAFGAALGIIAGRTVTIGRGRQLMLTPLAPPDNAGAGAGLGFTWVGRH